MQRPTRGLLPLLTRDPTTGGELIVTRLESPQTGLVIEGEFSLGWIALLTAEQLAFVGDLLRNRGNVQRLAAEMGVSYNTARNRLDDIVRALGATVEEDDGESPARSVVLDELAAGQIDYDEALRRLRD